MSVHTSNVAAVLCDIMIDRACSRIKLQVTALAAGNNVDLLAQQIVQFRPKVRACVVFVILHVYMYICAERGARVCAMFRFGAPLA